MTQTLTDLDAVQERVGKLPAPRDLKVITYLDAHAKRWLSLSTLGVVATGRGASLESTLCGGDSGFVRVNHDRQFAVSQSQFDESALDPGSFSAGDAFASLFFVPGMTETLRVNGVVEEDAAGDVRFTVRECYLHCGKALLRSEFWRAEPASVVPAEDDELLASARLLMLGSMSADGEADVSPKGDPAGSLLIRDGDFVSFPDRPGNRRIDSFRNILTQPYVSLLVLTPGISQVMRITGKAQISGAEEFRAAFAVKDKVPKLVTRVKIERLDRWESDVIERAKPWPPAAPPEDLRAAEIFKDHIKLSGERGVGASVARAAVSVPGVMKRGLESDYYKNLY
ncbi:MAG: pyridoxamine 5'-phosphate oxidase family protein [Pseudomonadota bacterium]